MTSSLGEIVQRLRRLKALSQEELADRARVRVKTLRAREKGLHEPRAATIQKIARALSIQPEELANGSRKGLCTDIGFDRPNSSNWPAQLLICRTNAIALYAVARHLIANLKAADLRSLVLPTGRTAALLFEYLLSSAQLDVSLFGNTHLFIDTETFGVSPEHPASRHGFVRARFIDGLRRRSVEVRETNVHFFSGYLGGENMFAEHDALLRRYRPVMHIVAYSPDGEIIGYGPHELAETPARYKDGCRVIHICENERRYIDPHQPSRAIVTIGLGNALAAQRIILPVLHLSKAGVLAKLLGGLIDHSCPATITRLHSSVTIITTHEIMRAINGSIHDVIKCEAEVDDRIGGEE